MIDKRLFLALPALALLAGCGGEGADEGGAATGEVLEGTISDAMLPLDRVRSEPPLEDPEAFAEAQKEAEEAVAAATGATENRGEDEDAEAAEAEGAEAEGVEAVEAVEAPAEAPAAEAE